jgi:serine/threonine protein kinase
MSSPIFRQVGPYEIERQIGRGGMALVFLARDTRPDGRVVALKVIPDGPDDDSREIAEAEERGARLQQQFLAGSEHVPEVYEVGRAPGYLYIAMEYLDGQDLAALLRQGPIDPRRAAEIAIAVCRFLEEVDELGAGTGHGSALTLLHNDLKPTNIRLVGDGRVKVLDFGAAKALSMSRRVTRNDFYSTPYLSPECLETGERDRHTDVWALGVILYEMVAGRAPFRADDTRRLEDRIRSRRPPDALGSCPPGLQAVIAKLLAPRPSDRYPGSTAVREDLERFLASEITDAESEGWPNVADDEPPTRRTVAAREEADEVPTRRIARDSSDPAVPAVSSSPLAPAAPAAPARRRRPWLRVAVVLLGASLALNEACVTTDADSVAGTVPLQEFSGLTNAWSQYDSLRSRSYLKLGTRGLRRALQRQTLILAERVTANYRAPNPTVRETQWAAASQALERAVADDPENGELRGTLRYTQGHLHRINGEADKSRGQAASAERRFADAVTAFREAASLRPGWPDPFLGLARTFIYGLEDVDRGADALAQAEKHGHKRGTRETLQLADGYKARGEALERAAGKLSELPQEKEFLERSRDAFKTALELYAKIADLPEVPGDIRATQRRLDVVEQRLDDMRPWYLPFTIPGVRIGPSDQGSEDR